MTEFYTGLIDTQKRTPDNILPFTNIVERIGEYNREVCIHPNGRNNISGPFVIHQRQQYTYRDGVIEQLPNVNFCTALASDDNG